MPLQMRYYGDPILRKISLPVEKINSEILDLIEKMKETMEEHNGIGLAAPQVGHLLRIFIVRLDFVGDNGEFLEGKTKIYINPKLSKPSEEMEIMNEGCLSIPKVYVDVIRPNSISVEALDINGHPFKEDLSGFTARQVMHENDHLNGTLIIDRCPREQKELARDRLQFIKKNMSLQ